MLALPVCPGILLLSLNHPSRVLPFFSWLGKYDFPQCLWGLNGHSLVAVCLLISLSGRLAVGQPGGNADPHGACVHSLVAAVGGASDDV